MEYVKIRSSHYEAVIEHLKNFFFADEPLNKSVSLCAPGQGHIELEKHSLITLEDGLSVMAITPEQEVRFFPNMHIQYSVPYFIQTKYIIQFTQIAGVCLNGVLLKGDLESALEKLFEKGDKEFQKIFNLLYGQSLRLNLFERLNVDKIFELRILSVDAKFRGQGIAKNLLIKSQEIAEQNGFRVSIVCLYKNQIEYQKVGHSSKNS